MAYNYLTIKEENEIHGSINEEEIVDLVTNKNIFNEDQILQIEAIDNRNLNATKDYEAIPDVLITFKEAFNTLEIVKNFIYQKETCDEKDIEILDNIAKRIRKEKLSENKLI